MKVLLNVLEELGALRFREGVDGPKRWCLPLFEFDIDIVRTVLGHAIYVDWAEDGSVVVVFFREYLQYFVHWVWRIVVMRERKVWWWFGRGRIR